MIKFVSFVNRHIAVYFEVKINKTISSYATSPEFMKATDDRAKVENMFQNNFFFFFWKRGIH